MTTLTYFSADTAVRDYLDAWAKRQVSLYFTNDSFLVDALLKESTDARRDTVAYAFQYDSIKNLYPVLPDARDIEDWDIDDCEEFLSEHGRLDQSRKDIPAPDDMADTDALESYLDVLIEYTKDCLRDIADNQEPVEIFEWWRITDSWLINKLSEHGEPVIDNDYGSWWGRTCSGQSIYLDGTLQNIYFAEFGIPSEDTLTEFISANGGNL